MDEALPSKTDSREPEMPKPAEQQHVGEVVAHATRSVLSASAYAGPIPPPDLLRQYDELVPGILCHALATATHSSVSQPFGIKDLRQLSVSTTYAPFLRLGWRG